MTDKSLSLEELEPVDRTSILDSVIEQLEGLIFGGFEPGEALPSEGKLAEALGVSRLTVREATRTLEARGLLEITQGRRPRVAAPNGALVGDFFKIAVRRDPRALLDLLDVRRALERGVPDGGRKADACWCRPGTRRITRWCGRRSTTPTGFCGRSARSGGCRRIRPRG